MISVINAIKTKLEIDLLSQIRENAERLQEKERVEKEKLQQIIDDADDYKDKHKTKREANREAQMKSNRDKELVFHSSLIFVMAYFNVKCFGCSNFSDEVRAFRMCLV